jgi:hypothetical protein
MPEIFLVFILFSMGNNTVYPFVMQRAPTMEKCLEAAEQFNKQDPDVQRFTAAQGSWACAAVVKPTI